MMVMFVDYRSREGLGEITRSRWTRFRGSSSWTECWSESNLDFNFSSCSSRESIGLGETDRSRASFLLGWGGEGPDGRRTIVKATSGELSLIFKRTTAALSDSSLEGDGATAICDEQKSRSGSYMQASS